MSRYSPISSTYTHKHILHILPSSSHFIYQTITGCLATLGSAGALRIPRLCLDLIKQSESGTTGRESRIQAYLTHMSSSWDLTRERKARKHLAGQRQRWLAVMSLTRAERCPSEESVNEWVDEWQDVRSLFYPLTLPFIRRLCKGARFDLTHRLLSETRGLNEKQPLIKSHCDFGRKHFAEFHHPAKHTESPVAYLIKRFN